MKQNENIIVPTAIKYNKKGSISYSEHRKLKVKCCCGYYISIGNLSTHVKTRKHIHHMHVEHITDYIEDLILEY
jgi:hypothetical protein